jgi:putative membrane protein
MRLDQLSKLLIVNVDRDNDIGEKTGLETPIVGREQCLQAAAKLSLADPEEADANAIFASVKMYDELVAKGYTCNVAVLAGVRSSDFDADQKVRREATIIINSWKPDGLVLVSDGVEDEKLVPVLQSLAPIVNVKRMVIKHSASVEESYEVLGRYLRMLIYDPRYSKFFLGVPGALLIIYGAMAFARLNISDYLYTIALVLGLSLIVRAFDLDKMVMETRRRTYFYPRFFAFIASLIILIVGFFQAYSFITTLSEYGRFVNDPRVFYDVIGVLAGNFIQKSEPYIWIAIGMNLVVALVYHALRRSTKAIRDSIAIITMALLYFPIYGFANVFIAPQTANPFEFIFLLLAGLAVLLVVVYFAYSFYQGRRTLSRDEG